MYKEKTCNFSTFTNLIIISFQAVATDYVVCISCMYFVQSVVAFKSYMMKLATKTRFCTAHLQFRAVGIGLGGQGAIIPTPTSRLLEKFVEKYSMQISVLGTNKYIRNPKK